MGMRRNIELDFYSYKNDKKIYFYTHWGAEDLKEELKRALIRGKGRWDDPSYLARIIFSEMIQEDIQGETGFGIAPYKTDPEFRTIKVNLHTKEVDGISFVEFIAKDWNDEKLESGYNEEKK